MIATNSTKMQNTLTLGNGLTAINSRPVLNHSFSYESEAKLVDEYLQESEFGSNLMLETPDINLDHFEFEMKPNTCALMNDTDYWLSGVNSSAVANNNSLAAPALLDNQTYSPKSQLESKEINLEYMSSPEMAPVSPNTVCPHVQYENTSGGLYSIESGPGYNTLGTNLDETNYLTNFIHSNAIQSSLDPMISMNTVVGSQQPFSPQSVSSNFSAESSEKTFANLDNVQSHSQQYNSPSSSTNVAPIITIKQEPDLYQPTVIEEFLYGDSSPYTSTQPIYSGHQQLQSMQVPQSVPLNIPRSYSTGSNAALNTNSTSSSTTEQNSQYYYDLKSGTSTQVQIKQQQPQSRCSPVPQLQQLTHQQPSPVPNVAIVGRKRTTSCASTSTNASGLSNHTNSNQGPSGSSAKKPRMTKREKQLMMDRQIEDFEKEQKELNEQITTLSKQIEFCKRYLSDNVKPVIQQQQMHQQPTFQNSY